MAATVVNGNDEDLELPASAGSNVATSSSFQRCNRFYFRNRLITPSKFWEYLGRGRGGGDGSVRRGGGGDCGDEGGVNDEEEDDDAEDCTVVVQKQSLSEEQRANKVCLKFAATLWGEEHEEVAMHRYEAENPHLYVERDSRWVYGNGAEAARLDGYATDMVTGERFPIEVKCPYKYREDDLNDEAGVLRNASDYIVWYDDAGRMRLNRDHGYYDQIQGEVFVTGAAYAILLLWTEKSLVTVKVDRDEVWGEEKYSRIADANRRLLRASYVKCWD